MFPCQSFGRTKKHSFTVTVLNIMAAGDYNSDADINSDGKVDIADFVTVLNIMAAN